MKPFWRETWRQVGFGLIMLGGVSVAVGRVAAWPVLLLSGGSSCILGASLFLIALRGPG